MDNEIPELKAMAEIARVFADLEEDEVQRVLRWANEKYRLRATSYSHATTPAPPRAAESDAGSAPHAFSDLPALIDATKPTNGLERILTAAYFHQVVNGEQDFDSQSLNSQLKHLGYPSANITRDMIRLVDRSPKLVIQTRKEGSSQQARKKFRLTTEGVRAVEAMLRKGQTSTE
jgi:hypothetical protein